MSERSNGVALAAALGMILGLTGAGPSAAQQHDPTLNSEDQLAPSQIQQGVPAAVAEPTGGSHTTAHPATHTAAVPRSTEPKPLPPSAHVVACTGIFSKESNHLRLAMTFD
ncbi:MAG TPA: hypothetical protein VJ353_16425, partial [Xanthobacteraceae bacterium]|nr:hypothetical protein [Xanthobacteraceae bacterium]